MKNEVKLSSIAQHMQIDLSGLPPDSVVTRKQSASDSEVVESENMVFRTWISTTAVDRDGDIVDPLGCDHTHFDANPVVLWSHAHAQPPVGKIRKLEIMKEGIIATIEMAPTELGRDLFSLVKGGFLRTSSVGFVKKESVNFSQPEFATWLSTRGVRAEGATRIITKWELIENSLCSIPSNPRALVIGLAEKSLTLSDGLVKQLHLDDLKAEEVGVPPVEQVVVPSGEKPVEPVVEPPTSVVQDTTQEVPVVEPPATPPPPAPPPEPTPEPKKEEPPTSTWTVLRVGPLALDPASEGLAKRLAAGELV